MICPAKRGFTLIELLVVIAIIAILSMVGVVAYSSVQNNVKSSSTKAELKTLRDAMLRYKTINGELPPVGDNCPACYPDDTTRANDLRNNLLAGLASTSNGGPYITELESFVYDGWGKPYYYDDNDANTTPGQPCQGGASANSPILSSGPDRTVGNGDDINFDIRCP